MRPEIAISAVMLSLVQESSGREVGFRKDIVGKLQSLRSSNVPLPGIRFRPGIKGPASDAVSDFVGRMAIAGFVVQESPIKLNADGLELLKQRTAEHMSDPDVARAASVLGITETLSGLSPTS